MVLRHLDEQDFSLVTQVLGKATADCSCTVEKSKYTKEKQDSAIRMSLGVRLLAVVRQAVYLILGLLIDPNTAS